MLAPRGRVVQSRRPRLPALSVQPERGPGDDNVAGESRHGQLGNTRRRGPPKFAALSSRSTTVRITTPYRPLTRISQCASTARLPAGEGPTHVVVGRYGSYRVARSGNRPGRSLETKSGLAGQATLQAVMRMKPAQASKVKSRTPTSLETGEDNTGREETDKTCPVRRGSGHGMQGR